MAIRLPVSIEAEYRGQAKPGEFVDRQTGEEVKYGPKLKFEIADDDGDVTILPIGGGQLDKCEPPFDHATLKRGDVVQLQGYVVLQDRGSDRDSYLSLRSVEPQNARAKLAA